MNEHENEAIEGEVINNTKTSKARIVKTSRVSKPTFRQVEFAKNYIEGNTKGNGTRSAIKAGYSERGAGQQASELLKNPNVLAILHSGVEEAETVIRSLIQSDSESIQLAAAKELLDRTQGKSVQRSENVNINISVEDMLS